MPFLSTMPTAFLSQSRSEQVLVLSVLLIELLAVLAELAFAVRFGIPVQGLPET